MFKTHLRFPPFSCSHAWAVDSPLAGSYPPIHCQGEDTSQQSRPTIAPSSRVLRDARLGRESYLHRPCGLQQAGNLCGSHSGQGPGAPGRYACSHRCHLHMGFYLYTRAGGREKESKRRDGEGGRFRIPPLCRNPSLPQHAPWFPSCR